MGRVFLFFIIPFLLKAQIIPIAKHDIAFRSILTRGDIYFVEADNKKFRCKNYINMDNLIKNLYRTKHYIMKNRKICAQDLYIINNNRVKFQFGLVEIEKEAELIKETKRYIQIRDKNGKIEKIYKDE